MFKIGIYVGKDSSEILQQRFIHAAARGLLEPIIDKKGRPTSVSAQGFNIKQVTALRRITGMSMLQWSRNDVLDFSNEVLMIYLRKIGCNAD